MRTILIIGIGAGHPDYLTVQAINALNRADVFFIPDKGEEKAALRQLRQDICARFVKEARFRTVDFASPKRAPAGDDYRASVAEWHARLEAKYAALIMEQLADGECGAFLVWGDPALYDSTLRIIGAIRSKGVPLDYEVIPGISAVQALAAQHRVALNRIGEPVLITTGRRLADCLPEGATSVVVMLDGEQAFKRVAPADPDIYWGAYLGTADEVLVSGRLSEVMGEIEQVRSELRDANGWIMDTYLLRTRDEP